MNVECSNCGSDIQEGDRFCHHCGASMGEGASTDPETRTSPGGRKEPERRQLTVLFCDLVGSTQLSERFDPEDLRDLIMTYQSGVREVISRYGGYIARHVGDGVLVLFGYPEAHEDDAERAVLAGLEIVDTISRIKMSLDGEQVTNLQVKIGIATGLVVAGDVIEESDSRQSEIFGRTPNLAARIRDVAAPNTVVVGPHTHDMLKDRFEYEAAGEQVLRGIKHPVRLWRVIRAVDIQARRGHDWFTGLTPMVNREDELEIFSQSWKRAKTGTSRVILISGDAGIGKSRVVHELYERIRSESIRYRFQCSAYFKNSAFYPVIRHLERAAGFDPGDEDQQKLEKLESLLAPLTDAVETSVPLIAALLSIPLEGRYPSLDMSPERQKEITLELMVNLLADPPDRSPVLVFVEDTHWIDPSSEELLFRLISRPKNASMLVVVTARGAFPARWTTQPGVILLTMDRLDQKSCTEIVGNLAGNRGLPDAVVRKIVARSDGVPLFVEELTKTTLTSGQVGDSEITAGAREYTLPESLQDSLAARLDQLNTGKRIAQIGAVIGREFSHALIAAVSGLPEDELDRALLQLREAGVIHAVGAPPGVIYVFKHALVRDAAYESLLKSRRRQLHAAIAGTMEAQFSNQEGEEPELVAHHYTEAELYEKAIPYWQKAGRQAMRRLAFSEAIEHARVGLGCVEHLEDPAGKIRAELGLRTLLGPALMAKQGYGSADVEEAYARARQLCNEVPESPELFPVLFGLWGFHVVRAEYRLADDLSSQLLSLGRASDDAGLMVEALGAAGVTQFYLGELTRAREHLEQGMAVYQPEEHSSHAFIYGQDPWVACSAFHGQTMWLLGYPDSALQSSENAVARAIKLGHHFTITFSQFLHCVVLQLRNEPDKLLAQAESGLRLSEEQGFPHWVPRFRLYRAWALKALERSGEAVAEMELCLDKSQPLSLLIRRPFYLALLAEARQENGDADGLAVIDEAIEELAVFEDRWSMPEIYRLKGELLLRAGEPNAGEAEAQALEWFERALELAREQEARGWELRILLSLYRLHRGQGRPEAVRKEVEAAMNWFTEGTNSSDWSEMRQTLERGRARTE